MSRPREHVDRLGGLWAVALFVEETEVAGEGRGVAGDVENVVGGKRDELFEETRGTALSGRIEDDGQRALDVKAHVVVVFGEADVELGVGDGVDPGVAAGVLDGLRVAFDADDPAGAGGQVDADASGTAVEIEDSRQWRSRGLRIFRGRPFGLCILRDRLDGRGTGIFEKLQNRVVQTLGLIGVDLEKGFRRDEVAAGSDYFFDFILSKFVFQREVAEYAADTGVKIGDGDKAISVSRYGSALRKGLPGRRKRAVRRIRRAR